MGLVVCDPVAVDEGEGVEGFLPAVDAADEFLGLALLVLDNEVEDFEGGLFVGELPTPAGGLPEPGRSRIVGRLAEVFTKLKRGQNEIA